MKYLWYLVPAGPQIGTIQTSSGGRGLSPLSHDLQLPSSPCHIPLPIAVSGGAHLWPHQSIATFSLYSAFHFHSAKPSQSLSSLSGVPRLCHSPTPHWHLTSSFSIFSLLTVNLHSSLASFLQATNMLKSLKKYNKTNEHRWREGKTE